MKNTMLSLAAKQLFVKKGGETITYKGTDEFVTIPCNVFNPKTAVSLQKSIDVCM